MKKLLQILIAVFLVASCQNKKSEVDLKLIPVKSDNYWGYIDKDGNIKINPQFSRANPFIEGIALVQSTDGKYGFIGEDGKYIINAQFKDATDFSNGLALTVKENGKLEYINTKGEVKITLDANVDYSTNFNSGYAFIFKSNGNGNYSIIGTDGKELFPSKYKITSLFHEGMAIVSNYDSTSRKETFGFINEKGELVIPFQFERVYDFHSGLARFSAGGKYGFIDKQGKFVINPQFDDVYDFEKDLALIKQGSLYGYIDKQGKIVINPQYKDANSFYSGLATVTSTDGKVGFIDEKGNYVINPQFEFATRFYGDISIIRLAGKFGIINKKGSITVNPKFDAVATEVRDFNRIYNDFFDTKEILDFVNNIINDKRLSSTTNFEQFKSNFPTVDVNDLSNFNGYDKVNSRFVELKVCELGFIDLYKFKDSFATNKVYDPVAGGYVSQNVRVGSNSTLNTKATLEYILFPISLQGKAREKKDEIFSMICKKIEANGFSLESDSYAKNYSNKSYKLRLYKTENVIYMTFVYNGNNSVGTNDPNYDVSSPNYNRQTSRW